MRGLRSLPLVEGVVVVVRLVHQVVVVEGVGRRVISGEVEVEGGLQEHQGEVVGVVQREHPGVVVGGVQREHPGVGVVVVARVVQWEYPEEVAVEGPEVQWETPLGVGVEEVVLVAPGEH